MNEYLWIGHIIILLLIGGRLVLSYIQHFQARKDRKEAQQAAERAQAAAAQARINAEKARALAEKAKQARAAQPAAQAAPPPPKKAPEKKFPPQVGGKVLAYHYDDIMFQPAMGAENNLQRKEPLQLSEHSGTVYLLQQNQLIGNLYENQVADMVRDWIKRGDLVLAYVTALPTSHSAAKVSVYFYRNI